MRKLNIVNAKKFKQALIANGYREPQLGILMAQAAHETNGFNKQRAVENNNYGGVKYNKSLKDIAAPSEDYLAPASEGDGVRVPYARFANIDDFVKRWIPYANLNRKRKGNNEGAPLAAADLRGYAHRLKLNAYFQDNESNYFNGLTAWDKAIRATEELNQVNAVSRSDGDKLKTLQQDVSKKIRVFGKPVAANPVRHTETSFFEWPSPIVGFFDRLISSAEQPGNNGHSIRTRRMPQASSIDRDRPMISEVVIDDKQIREGLDRFKQQVEEALINILKSEHIIH